MKQKVEKLKIPHRRSKVFPHSYTFPCVTLSIGVASINPTWDNKPSDLILVADNALYEAKKFGRNRAVLKFVH